MCWVVVNQIFGTMRYLRVAVIAFGLLTFVACNNKDSSSDKSTEQTEKEKTKININTGEGEAGFENEDVDVDVKVKPDSGGKQ